MGQKQPLETPMSEKIESIQIHPMRGHSRGDWYATLDDIAASEEDAEYWALFGLTRGGNTHCLGEFPTKSAAMRAKRLFNASADETRKAADDRYGRQH